MQVKTDFIPSDFVPIDIHCHQIRPSNHLQILSVDTHEPTQEIIENCKTYFSIGIHPWFIEHQNIDIALQKLKSYRHHPKLAAIGECGLDKAIAAKLSLQTRVFEQQLELAEQWRKPLIIHCVRAFNELMQIKKNSKSTLPWIIHGFNNNPELAKQLLKQNCYLSFGKALLRDHSNAAQVLQSMPLDQLFLETDDTREVSISAIYDAAAKITGLTVDALRQQIFGNFNRVFFND